MSKLCPKGYLTLEKVPHDDPQRVTKDDTSVESGENVPNIESCEKVPNVV